MCEKSGIFDSNSVYQRTVPAPLQKKTYRTSVPYFLTKIGHIVPYLRTRAANSNLNSNSKKLGYFAELELEREKIIFLNSNSDLNSSKIVRVCVH